MHKYTNTPIVATATAPGHAGIAIVRISGNNLQHMACVITKQSDIIPKQAKYCNFYDHNDEIIDSGLIIYFKAPSSFTGEDVIELHAHGNPIILQLLINQALTLGCRLANPGEFSQRAYYNGKLDLVQAESIVDLINAESEKSVKGALQSLQGKFSKYIYSLNSQLIDLRMFVEASLDFPEEDIEFIANAKIHDKLELIQTEINKLIASANHGVILATGANIVIIGRPNVGKSTLLNALANEDIAIVTDIPGTTRDLLKEKIIINGIKCNLIDTAGIRTTTDQVEQIGIDKALASSKQADLCLIIIDATIGITDSDRDILKKIPTTVPRLFVHNKIDLLPGSPKATNSDISNNSPQAFISARNDVGLDALREMILKQIGYDPNISDNFSARARHLSSLRSTAAHITNAFHHWHNLELLAEELRYAHNTLGEITGEFTADDLIGEIFSRFCIGK